MRKIIQVLEIFLKYSKVAKMNFKSRKPAVEWKLVAWKGFEKFSYAGVPSSPKLLLHELVQWIPLFGTMKFVHACWKSNKNKRIVENQIK